MHSHPRHPPRRKPPRTDHAEHSSGEPIGKLRDGNAASLAADGDARSEDHIRSQLRALSARLLEVREQERAAISRRVHDELGQALTTLQWDVEKLSEELALPDSIRPTNAGAKLKAMSATIAGALHTVRMVATELRPPMLDQFGLLAAIRWQAGEFQTRYGILCEILSDRERYAPSRGTATATFRIFQEILTNVARHACATLVRVRLGEESGALTLVVQDNGKGIPDGRESASLGILGMRERAWLLGGSLEIAAGRRSGTTVSVRIPLQSACTEEEGIPQAH